MKTLTGEMVKSFVAAALQIDREARVIDNETPQVNGGYIQTPEWKERRQAIRNRRIALTQQFIATLPDDHPMRRAVDLRLTFGDAWTVGEALTWVTPTYRPEDSGRDYDANLAAIKEFVRLANCVEAHDEATTYVHGCN